jgi:hypothetical protein
MLVQHVRAVAVHTLGMVLVLLALLFQACTVHGCRGSTVPTSRCGQSFLKQHVKALCCLPAERLQ